MPIRLEIVTPERRVYEDDVDIVVVPGSEGELGILPHHAPLVSMLGVGELRIRKGGVEESFAIVGGFLQVRPDKVVVMAETADMASDIDLEKAHEARFKRLLDHVVNGTVFQRGEKIYWRCRECGYIHEGTAAPKVCPACAHPQAFFEPVGESF